MKISQEGLDLIAGFEGLRLTAYLDTIAVPNIWTIGYGHTLTAKRGMTITKDKALQLLKEDCAWFEDVVNNEVNVPLTQAMFDALVSLTYNIGGTRFAESTLLKKLNEGDYHGAQTQFHVWRKAGGKVVQGLVNRRDKEAKYFASEGLNPQLDFDEWLKTGEIKPINESWWVKLMKWLKKLAGATA